MPAGSPSGSLQVRAWYARTSDLPAAARTAHALRWLAPGERSRYDRFRSDDDRAMFLVGRMIARALVGRAMQIHPTAWEWREGSHGRPEIGTPATPLQFNLAHSAGLVVCVLAENRDVGVDVEDLKRRPVDYALVARYCSPIEIADVEQAGPTWHDRFLVYWTLKEAYVKARGLGIAVPLSEITFSLQSAPRIDFIGSLAGTDTRWCFEVTQPTDRHLVAIAASTSDGVRPQISLTPFDWDVVAP